MFVWAWFPAVAVGFRPDPHPVLLSPPVFPPPLHVRPDPEQYVVTHYASPQVVLPAVLVVV